jgi:hypothetical protein
MRAMNVGENTPSVQKDSTDVRDALRSPAKKRRDGNLTTSSFYTFKSRDNILQKIQNPFKLSSFEGPINDSTPIDFPEFKNCESSSINGSGDFNNNGNNNNNNNSNSSEAKHEVARSDTTSKLEVFIICRLGTMN